MKNDLTKDGATIVMTAGVPLPVPRGNENSVRGGAIGGGLGALVAGVFMFSPLGIALLAAAGAFTGAAIGTNAEQKARQP
jgi:uncharacterized membrane protein